MARVKGGLTAQKRRRNILSQVKGYRFARSKKKRTAREAIYHAQLHAFSHRRDKKTVFRQLFITRINAALKPHELKYSRFIKALADAGISLDRKVLSTLAKDYPAAFERVVAKVK